MLPISLLRILCLLFSALTTVSSLNILVSIVAIGYSHLKFMTSIAENLARAGHNVDVVIIPVDPKYSTYNSTKVNVIQLNSTSINPFVTIKFAEQPFEPVSIWDTSLWSTFAAAMRQANQDVLDNVKLIKDLKSNNYDIGIAETWGPAPFAVLYLAGVRNYILAQATPLLPPIAAAFGIPLPPSYAIGGLSEGLSVAAPHFTFSQRAQNLFFAVFNNYLWPALDANWDRMFSDAVDADFPSGFSLLKSSAIVLVNMPAILSLPQPTSTRIINIGGITLQDDAEQTPNTNNKNLESFFSKSAKVVYVSFGTVAKTTTIRGELLSNFLEAFSAFPDFQFLWKFDVTEDVAYIFKQYPNIHCLNWAPQKEILNHPKTKAFVSHMGMNSFLEGSFYGVPFVSIPFFADQHPNTAAAIHKGCAVFVDKLNVTADNLKEALTKVLYDPSYSQSAQILKQELLQYPEPPVKKMVSWVEYIGKVGRLPSLDLPGMNHSLVEYFCLDVLFGFILSLLLSAYISLKLFVFLCKRCCCRKNTKEKRE